MTEYIDMWKRSFDFEGWSSRKEYWMPVLINLIVSFVLSLLCQFIGTYIPIIIYNILFIVPSISISVRRLHDINKSGFWMFISFVPLIGFIWLLVLLCQDSVD